MFIPNEFNYRLQKNSHIQKVTVAVFIFLCHLRTLTYCKYPSFYLVFYILVRKDCVSEIQVKEFFFNLTYSWNHHLIKDFFKWNTGPVYLQQTLHSIQTLSATKSFVPKNIEAYSEHLPNIVRYILYCNTLIYLYTYTLYIFFQHRVKFHLFAENLKAYWVNMKVFRW